MDGNNRTNKAAQSRAHSIKEDMMKTGATINRKKNRGAVFMALAAGLIIIAMVYASAEARGPFGIQKTPAQIVERLTDRLGLTDEQVLAIQPVIEEKVEKMKEIRSKIGTDRQAARIEMQKLRWDTEVKLNNILTTEQIEKYLELRQDRQGTFKRGKFSGRRMGKGFNKTPEQVIERMTARLNLTGEQAEAIKPYIEAGMEKKRAIFEKYGEKRQEVRQAMREEMQIAGDETEAGLSTILTDEQMEELRAFREKRHERMDRRKDSPGPARF